MYGVYRSLTFLISPLLPFWLQKRQRRGKEDAARMGERFGVASLPRPAGALLWVHAASVGEANAALPLINSVLSVHTGVHVLLTTGTVTSAALVKDRLPARAMHQFIPVDTPQAVSAFLRHWKPQIALLIDSELWPNLIEQARRSGAVMGLVNARMSQRSYHAWQWGRAVIGPILQVFSLCFAQSEDDARRLQALGLRQVQHVGNLKYDVPPLDCNENELARLRSIIGERMVFLAASTHPGEEAHIARLHRELRAHLPGLLTIIVPRHATRAGEISTHLSELAVARRSAGQALMPATDIYLADTMGELGLFYRLAQVAFIGGSLVPHGGQNPLEALKLGCPVICGPHMENFQTVVDTMKADGACIQVNGVPALYEAARELLTCPEHAACLRAAGFAHVQKYAGSLEAVMAALQPHLAPQGKAV